MNASRAGFYSALIGWVVAVGGVWLWSTGYGFTTYEASDRFANNAWPHHSNLTLANDRPTLLFFMHPRCPCTRASIRELEKLLTGQGLTPQQQPKSIIVASLPSKASEQWRDTFTIERAASLPHATLVWDADGIESGRFGAVASGTVMVYAPNGMRLFAGGITASRGHEGDNAGSDRVRAILAQDNRSPQESTPTFGCRLCITGFTTAAPMAGAVKCDDEKAICDGESP